MPEKKESMKERLARYQEAIRQKKQYEKAERVKVVQKLDESKKDITRFHSPPSRKRPPTTVPAEMVGKISESLLIDFESSFRLDTTATDFVGGTDTVGVPPTTSLLRRKSSTAPMIIPEEDSTNMEEQEEILAKNELDSVLQQHETTAVEEVEEEKPFQSLQKRYLKAIDTLRPGTYHNKTAETDSPKKDLKDRVLEDAETRRKFIEAREAWDKYEERAQDRPYEPTPDEEQINEDIKKVEMDVATAWVDHAEKIAEEIIQREATDDTDDEDLLRFIEEARRMRAENEKRQKRKEKAERKRRTKWTEEKLLKEDKQLLEEAKRLMEKHKQKELVKKQRLANGESLEAVEAEEENESLPFSDDEIDASSGSSEGDFEGKGSWLEEARRRRNIAYVKKIERLAAQGVPPYKVVSDENSDDDREVVRLGRRLRRAYIDEAEEGDSDSDIDVDDVPTWIQASRELKFGEGDEGGAEVGSGGDGVQPCSTDLKEATGAPRAQRRLSLLDKVKLDFNESNSDGTLRSDVAAHPEVLENASKLAVARREYLSSKAALTDGSSDESDDEKEKWLQEAKLLRESALAKTSMQENGSTPAESISGGLTGGADDKTVVKEAKNIRREYIQERLRRGYDDDSDEDEDEEDIEDLSLWIELAKRKMDTKVATQVITSGNLDIKGAIERIKNERAKVSSKNKVTNAKYESSDEDSDDSEVDEAKKAEWREEARKLRERALAARKTDLTSKESRAVHGDNITAQDDVDDDSVVKLALKLEKAHRKSLRDADGDSSTSDEDGSPAKWIQEVKQNRPVIASRTKTGSIDVSKKEADRLADPSEEAWREEARRLREAAVAKEQQLKLAKAVSASSKESEVAVHEDNLIAEAQKLRREHIAKISKTQSLVNDDGDADDLALWIEVAGKKIESNHSRALVKAQERSKPKKKWYEESDDDSDVDETEKNKRLDEAREMRARAVASKTRHDSDSDSEENVSMKLVSLKKAKKRGEKPSQRQTSSYEDDDKSRWLEEARRLKQEALAKKKMDELSAKPSLKSTTSSQAFDSPKASASYDRSKWLDDAKKLKEEAITKIKQAKEKNIEDDRVSRRRASTMSIGVNSFGDATKQLEEAMRQSTIPEEEPRRRSSANEQGSLNFWDTVKSVNKGSDDSRDVAHGRDNHQKTSRPYQDRRTDDFFASLGDPAKMIEEANRKNLETLTQQEQRELDKLKDVKSKSVKSNSIGSDESDDSDSEKGKGRVRKHHSHSKKNKRQPKHDSDGEKTDATKLRREKSKENKSLGDGVDESKPSRKDKRDDKKKDKKKEKKKKKSKSKSRHKSKPKSVHETEGKSTSGEQIKSTQEGDDAEDDSNSDYSEYSVSESETAHSGSEKSIDLNKSDPNLNPPKGNSQGSLSFWDSFTEKTKQAKEKKEVEKQGKAKVADSKSKSTREIEISRRKPKKAYGGNDSSAGEEDNDVVTANASSQEKVCEEKVKSKSKSDSKKSTDNRSEKVGESLVKKTAKLRRSYGDDSSANETDSDASGDAVAAVDGKDKPATSLSPKEAKGLTKDSPKPATKLQKAPISPKPPLSPKKPSSKPSYVQSIARSPQKLPVKSPIVSSDSTTSDLPEGASEASKALAQIKDHDRSPPASSLNSISERNQGSESVDNQPIEQVPLVKAKSTEIKLESITSGSSVSQSLTSEVVQTKPVEEKSKTEENQKGIEGEQPSTSAKMEQKQKDIALIENDQPLKKQDPKIDATGWRYELKDWINRPPGGITIKGPKILMNIPGKTECWRKTRAAGTHDTAPIHWLEMQGDFEVICKISGNMHSKYDKAGIVIRFDEANWVFSGLEFDGGRMNNSTLVTLDSTDRSVSPLPQAAEKAGVWFCIKRIKDSFECFYSFDVKIWIQTRQGLLTQQPSVQVGISGACPQGSGFQATWEYFKCRAMVAPTTK